MPLLLRAVAIFETLLKVVVSRWLSWGGCHFLDLLT